MLEVGAHRAESKGSAEAILSIGEYHSTQTITLLEIEVVN